MNTNCKSEEVTFRAPFSINTLFHFCFPGSPVCVQHVLRHNSVAVRGKGPHSHNAGREVLRHQSSGRVHVQGGDQHRSREYSETVSSSKLTILPESFVTKASTLNSDPEAPTEVKLANLSAFWRNESAYCLKIFNEPTMSLAFHFHRKVGFSPCFVEITPVSRAKRVRRGLRNAPRLLEWRN